MSLNCLSLLYLIAEKEIFVNTLNVVRIIIIIFNYHFKISASCIIPLSFFLSLFFFLRRYDLERYRNALSLAIHTVYNALNSKASDLKRTNHNHCNFCDSADPLVDTNSAEYRFFLSLSFSIPLVISKERRRAESVKPCTGSLRLQGTKVVNDLTVGKELLREGAEKTPRAVSYTIDTGLDSPFVQKPRRSLRYARQGATLHSGISSAKSNTSAPGGKSRTKLQRWTARCFCARDSRRLLDLSQLRVTCNSNSILIFRRIFTRGMNIARFESRSFVAYKFMSCKMTVEKFYSILFQ